MLCHLRRLPITEPPRPGPAPACGGGATGVALSPSLSPPPISLPRSEQRPPLPARRSQVPASLSQAGGWTLGLFGEPVSPRPPSPLDAGLARGGPCPPLSRVGGGPQGPGLLPSSAPSAMGSHWPSDTRATHSATRGLATTHRWVGAGSWGQQELGVTPRAPPGSRRTEETDGRVHLLSVSSVRTVGGPRDERVGQGCSRASWQFRRQPPDGGGGHLSGRETWERRPSGGVRLLWPPNPTALHPRREGEMGKLSLYQLPPCPEIA